MKEKVLQRIDKIKIPQTESRLVDGDRTINVDINGENLIITYDREGIDVAAKRAIEEAIHSVLADIHDPEKILVKTTSAQNETENRPQSKPAGATLEVGHGKVGEKKKLDTVKNLIAVSSCKGGVGKSTVTTNLALSLKNAGYKVGIIDADIYGPSLPTLFGKRDGKPMASERKKIMPLDVQGLKLISFGFFVPESDPVIWRGPMLGGVLNQFLFDVEWGELDFLLIDMPPGTGDIQLSLIQSVEVQGSIVVSTPQQVALLDSKKGMKMFQQLKVPIYGIVENMSYFVPNDNLDKKYHIFGEGGVEKFCSANDVKFLGQIPIEIELREASDSGNPYMGQPQFEGRPVWKAYTQLAQDLAAKCGMTVGEKKAGFFNRLFKGKSVESSKTT